MTRVPRVAVGAAAVVLTGLVLVMPAGPAYADNPVGWEQAEPMSPLTALLVFGGIPLAICALIALLVLAPSLARGDRQQPDARSWSGLEWFGAGHRERPPQLERRPGELQPAQGPGGASARW